MKKINYKVILLIIGTILFESLFYLMAKLTFFEPFLLTSVIDDKLPLVPFFIYFYIFWYLMLFFVPYIIYVKNKDKFYEYLAVIVVSILISSMVFFFFPTTIIRGNIESTNITTFILNFIYLTDTPALNCLPSMHCAVCFMFIYYSFKIDIKWYYKLLIIILSILVIISTLLIKQHVIWDVFAALLLVIIAVLVVKKSKIKLFIKNKLNKFI